MRESHSTALTDPGIAPRTPLTIELVAGRPCLDFANHMQRVLGSPAPYAAVVELSLSAGLVTTEEARRLTLAAGRAASRAQAVVHRAAVLAEALRQVFEPLACGNAVPEAALGLVNREVRQAYANAEIGQHAGSLQWRWIDATPEPLDRPLWPVARDAADLLAHENPCRFKVCGDDSCRWLFLDTSKNCSRRWCNMSTCGNRAKARRFRKRQQAGTERANP